MSIDTVLAKRAMLAAFRQRANPTMFLSQWFKTTPRDIFRSKKCVIDVKRNQEAIAVDVVRGTGGRLNDNKKFTTKEYTPPMYNEYMVYQEDELNDRMPGMDEYNEDEYASQFMAIVAEDQVELRDLILRSIEKQAADTIFTGKTVLINSDTVDYKQKATHNFAVATKWSTSGTPISDLATACALNRKDGKIVTGTFVGIFGEGAYNNLLAREEGPGLKFDMRFAKLADIVMPTMNTAGAVYHGTVAAGSYNVQIWTYPQNYRVPTGFSLANEGTDVPYVPTDLVAVLPPSNMIDLRLVYAGIPSLVNRVDPRLQAFGLNSMPVNIRTDFHPYAIVDQRALSVEIGVRSSALTVPTQIDGFTIIKTEQ